jgi:acetyl-CoA decarbonylase/synthase complex subunit gamma
MALSGLDIYKQLPKTNCKECGFPTCLAFAMKLAQKGTELSKCPYVTEETRAALDAAAAPPIRLVSLGVGERAVSVGNETVMFRHEKTFVHPPALMLRVADDATDLAARVELAGEYSVERVGMLLVLGGVVVENRSGDAATFAKAVAAVHAGAPGVPIVLMSPDPKAIEAGLGVVGAERPLIHAAMPSGWEAFATLAKRHNCPLVIRAASIDGLAELSALVTGAGVEDVVLDPSPAGAGDSLALFTQLRRLALKKNFRPLGYPIIAFAGAESVEDEVIAAAQAIAKYAGVIVLDHAEPALFYTLLTLCQNLYTDPQKPIQVEPKLYAVGTPGADSPLLITTNFSLTYFSVSGEVEASGKPCWLLVADADGLSVLTSWAAGKFDAVKIAKTVKESGLAEKLSHRKLVIPGHVAGLSGEVEEELPGWQIMVGPRDAVEIPSYLKTVWSAS